MCTITLVPSPDSFNGFILTSNRDEAVSRKTFPPDYTRFNSKKMYFPKDGEAGGTWIGVSEIERCICIMNGAEKPHTRKSNYRKSRGVVVKEFLAEEDLVPLLDNYELEGIEPFTMIIVDWSNGLLFYQLIWNGKERKIQKLKLGPHIWSSSPLYTEEMKSIREKWFTELKESEGFSSESLLHFHHTAGKGDMNKGLIIDRGFLKTQSITQVYNASKNLKFWYKNLNTNEISEDYIQFSA